MAETNTDNSLLKATDLATELGDTDCAIKHAEELVAVETLFEDGYVMEPNAARENLERLIAQRDGPAPAQRAQTKNPDEAHEKEDSRIESDLCIRNADGDHP